MKIRSTTTMITMVFAAPLFSFSSFAQHHHRSWHDSIPDFRDSIHTWHDSGFQWGDSGHTGWDSGHTWHDSGQQWGDSGGFHHHGHRLADAAGNTSVNVTIYPNPVAETATIHIENSSGNVLFRLFD